jgi:membrane-bound ClpP family serine protease
MPVEPSFINLGSPTVPSSYLQLGDSVAIILLIVFIVIVAVIGIYFVVWSLSKKPVTGVESLKGKLGVAVSDFQKDAGEVSVDGVIWKARIYEGSNSAPQISKGEPVVVMGVSSLTLLVRPKKEK